MGRLATANQGPKRVGPTEALDLTANAYVRAMQAVEAIDAAEQEGASEEDLKALRAEARTAKATYDKFFNNATAMGIKRTDIMSRGDQMLEMAIPEEAESAEAAAGGEEQGWGSYLLRRANPVTAIPDDIATVRDMYTNYQNMQPGANAEELEGVTPPGNVELRPAPEAVLSGARAAIANGADPKAVAQRLMENGFSIEGL
jgi:hypothetical protein